MEGKTFNLIADASGKLTSSPDEDKCNLYESTRTDSGFISGEIVSGDNFLSEEEVSSSCCDPEPVMRLDSGVVVDSLSDNFSSLSLKHPDLNDLGGSGTKQQIKHEPQTPPPPVVLTEKQPAENDVPWMAYYEQDEEGDTYLHAAIMQRNPEVTLALIRMAPTPRLLDTLNDDAQSPLHLAVATGQPRVARWLIVAGARPDPRNMAGDSPLHIAARTSDINCCRAIMEPVHPQEKQTLALGYMQGSYPVCNIDQWNYNGQTCVHVAAMKGHTEVLKYLVWYGADINSREGTTGYTALHYAIATGNERLAQFLLAECPKLNPKILSYGGRSPLQLGAPVSHTLAQILRSRGVSSPYTSDDEDDYSSEEDEYVPTMPSTPMVTSC